MSQGHDENEQPEVAAESPETPEPTVAGARAAGALLDRTLKAVTGLPWWVLAGGFLAYGVLVYPYGPPTVSDDVLGRVFDSKVTLLIARMAVLGVVIGMVFILRSIFALLEQRRYASSAAGVTAEQAAADHEKTRKQLATAQKELKRDRETIAQQNERLRTSEANNERLIAFLEDESTRAHKAEAELETLREERSTDGRTGP